MAGFAQALPVVLRFEGGTSNDAADRGGLTRAGVTQKTYDEWRAAKGLPARSVREITPTEIEQLYHQRYWLAARCDAVPWPMSLGVFDCAVNHGPRGAWRIWQRALGVKEDGVPGPQTLAAIQQANADALMWAAEKARLRYYARICQADPSQLRFLEGWQNRAVELHHEMRRLA